MSSKRKHKTLSLKDKMNILKKLDNGENMCELAKEYGVGRATIYDLKKKKEKILGHVKTMESGPGKRKTLRLGNCPKMETALYTWFMQERSKHIPVSEEILKVKAIEFYKKITKKDDFRASDGWLNKFKKRFGIRRLTKSGEKLSSDESAVQPLVQRFKDQVEELCLLPDQIFNADESGPFWRLLPNKTYVSSKEASASGRKDQPVIKKVGNPALIKSKTETGSIQTGHLPTTLVVSTISAKDKKEKDEELQSKLKSDDEITSFTNFIAMKMRKYSETTNIAVQQAICDIIFKADKNFYETSTCDSTIAANDLLVAQSSRLYTASTSARVSDIKVEVKEEIDKIDSDDEYIMS